MRPLFLKSMRCFYNIIVSHCLLYYFWHYITFNNKKMYGPKEYSGKSLIQMVKTIIQAIFLRQLQASTFLASIEDSLYLIITSWIT